MAHQRSTNHLWIDVETTGLDPAADLLLEIALVVTGPGPTFPELYAAEKIIRHEASAAYERANDFVRTMHENSGLWQAIDEAGALSSTDLETDLMTWCSEQLRALAEHGIGKNAKVPLSGQSPQFDRGFLTEDAPLLISVCNHRHFDVSTLLQVAAVCGPELPKQDMPHRGLADIRQTIDSARTLLSAWLDIRWRGVDV